MHGTRPGVFALLDRLSGVRDNSGRHPEWVADCPVCDAEHRFCIAYKTTRLSPTGATLVGRCAACGSNGGAVAAAVGMTWGEVARLQESLALHVVRAEPDALPTDWAIGDWQENLWGFFCDEQRDYLLGARGLSEAVVRRFRIGWVPTRRRFSLPMFDRGRLVGLRYASPDQHPKMLGLKGHPIRLYPGRPRCGSVVVCEGEWDSLVLRAHGVHAVTSTGGKDGWRDDWNRNFVGRHVAVMYDCEARAQEAAAKVASHLVSVARSVRVVDLGLPDKGDDVTDWFLCYGRSAQDLRRLINGTAPLGSGGRRGA